MKTPLQRLIEWHENKDKFSQITWIELDANLQLLKKSDNDLLEQRNEMLAMLEKGDATSFDNMQKEVQQLIKKVKDNE
jgi:hypothetical protein